MLSRGARYIAAALLFYLSLLWDAFSPFPLLVVLDCLVYFFQFMFSFSLSPSNQATQNQTKSNLPPFYHTSLLTSHHCYYCLCDRQVFHHEDTHRRAWSYCCAFRLSSPLLVVQRSASMIPARVIEGSLRHFAVCSAPRRASTLAKKNLVGATREDLAELCHQHKVGRTTALHFDWLRGVD